MGRTVLLSVLWCVGRPCPNCQQLPHWQVMENRVSGGKVTLHGCVWDSSLTEHIHFRTRPCHPWDSCYECVAGMGVLPELTPEDAHEHSTQRKYWAALPTTHHTDWGPITQALWDWNLLMWTTSITAFLQDTQNLRSWVLEASLGLRAKVIPAGDPRSQCGLSPSGLYLPTVISLSLFQTDVVYVLFQYDKNGATDNLHV